MKKKMKQKQTRLISALILVITLAILLVVIFYLYKHLARALVLIEKFSIVKGELNKYVETKQKIQDNEFKKYVEGAKLRKQLSGWNSDSFGCSFGRSYQLHLF